ncbi:DinB family protein [Microscilla marina]|nr:DinB family protein [Microscilla marina]
MNFHLDKSIELLARTPQAYKELFTGLQYDWAHINEGANTWNAFDIVGHLIHGEQTDWVPRGRIILGNQADKTFVPFDRFAQEQLSVGKTMDELLEEFDQLRQANLQELKSWNLSPTDLAKTGIHPDLGTVTLQELLATWTIHDMAHLNQISRALVKHYAQDVGPWHQYIRLLKDKQG